MIAFFNSAASWFLGTKAGRVMAMIAAGVLAIATFGWTMRRRGAADEHARQVEADRAAIQRADLAERAYRNDGGAAERLRRGEF